MVFDDHETGCRVCSTSVENSRFWMGTDMERPVVKQLIPGIRYIQSLLLGQAERERDSSTMSQSDIRGLRPESQSRMTMLRRERDAL